MKVAFLSLVAIVFGVQVLAEDLHRRVHNHHLGRRLRSHHHLRLQPHLNKNNSVINASVPVMLTHEGAEHHVSLFQRRGPDADSDDAESDANTSDESTEKDQENQVETDPKNKDKSDSETGKDARETQTDEDDEDEEDDDDVPKELSRGESVMIARAKRNVSHLGDELDYNIKLQAETKATLVEMNDVHGSEMEIRNTVKEVVNQTASPALGSVLGRMWEEMRKYARPFFKKHLADKLDKLKKEEVILHEQLKEAQETLQRMKDEFQESANKRKHKDDKKQEPDDAKTKATDELDALYTSHTMPPVSPTVMCVIILCIMYFVIYTLKDAITTVNQNSPSAYCTRAQKAVEDMCTSVTYAPALSVLFVATRMRAIQLTKGETEKYQLPEPWVQNMMYACTVALPLQAILLLILALMKQSSKGSTPAQQDPQPMSPVSPRRKNRPVMNTVVAIFYYLFMALLYGGFTGVCIGAVIMEPPKLLWKGAPVPISTALGCTLALTTMFFSMYLCWALVWIIKGRANGSKPRDKLEYVTDAGKDVINLAPMLAILFVLARLRALQVGIESGDPQPWATRSMVVATIAIAIQANAASILPLLDKGEVENGVFAYKTKAIKLAEVVIRQVALLSMFVCALAVMFAVILLHSPTGYQHTPALSTTLHCVFILTNVYFAAYFMYYVAKAVQEFMVQAGKDSELVGQVVAAIDSGRQMVMLVPMLAILFIAARMRALQLTVTVFFGHPPAAGPQEWVQTAMVVSTIAVIMRLVLTYIMTLFLPQADKKKQRPLEILSYACLAAVYVGAILTIVGIFIMTPETLPPYAKHVGF